MATIDENVDEELDVESEGFKQLAAFFKKDAAKTQKSKGIKKNSTKKAKDSTYVDIKDIQEKAFKSCYTTQEWTKRRQTGAPKANGVLKNDNSGESSAQIHRVGCKMFP
eukprot:COSAG02_NODE_1822_length_10761_cov_48.708685_7_plen_109_part_00